MVSTQTKEPQRAVCDASTVRRLSPCDTLAGAGARAGIGIILGLVLASGMGASSGGAMDIE